MGGTFRYHVWIAAAALPLLGCPGSGGPPWHIEGSARLPSCTDPPGYDLDGTTWLDRGRVHITSDGCEPYRAGDEVGACTLRWEVTQQGGEVEILVDGEYRIFGRLCGEQLHLQGGWWLPVENETGYCTYDGDYAEEVVIEQEASLLEVTEEAMTGRLRLRSRDCTGEYHVAFEPF